jgi:hypothetical protein
VHAEGGKAIEISFGILNIHTFKKLPMHEPKINEAKRIKFKEYIGLLSQLFCHCLILNIKKRKYLVSGVVNFKNCFILQRLPCKGKAKFLIQEKEWLKLIKTIL